MWQRVVLWIILAVCLLTITVYPVLSELAKANTLHGGEMTRFMERKEEADVIRMNTSWICITLAVIGLGIIRPPKP